MRSFVIPDSETLQNAIQASHERCRQFGVNPNEFKNVRQKRLSNEALSIRLEQSQEYLDIAVTQIKELYQFVAGAGFAVTIADKDGYILHMIGDEPTLDKLENGNCAPGYRWTEKDVGTSVISLSLALEMPVQINDEEHYCRRGHGHTCSCSPVFGPADQLVGVIAMSGDADKVHPHTLGMVITAARAIENQLRITKASKELLLRNNYMNALIESIDSGVMAVDENGMVAQINNQGKKVLKCHADLVGNPISNLFGTPDEWQRMMLDGSGYGDREIFIRTPKKSIHLLVTAKPIFDVDEQVQGIIVVFHEINRIRRLVNEMAGSQARFTFNEILGTSEGIQQAKDRAILAAAGISNVLLLGPTGTGKELFSQAIHNQSERNHHPFVAINCGAIPRELLESELFGYTEGAFTGAKKGGRPGKLELASGGTVLLDEIGDMPLDMQVKLLRVLQTGEVYRIGEHKPITVDLRIIAATHHDLKKEVLQGNFREDLFYRLNVLPIQIPPLKERKEDIIPLANHIIKRCRQVLKKPDVHFSPEAEEVLFNYHWPGNVRELENIVERAVNLVHGHRIEPELFGLRESVMIPSPAAGFEYKGTRLADLEKQAIIHVLAETGNNFSKSSKILGITRATLYNKIKKYNLSGNRQSV